MTQGRPERLKLFYQQEQAEDIGVSVPEGDCRVLLGYGDAHAGAVMLTFSFSKVWAVSE